MESQLNDEKIPSIKEQLENGLEEVRSIKKGKKNIKDLIHEKF